MTGYPDVAMLIDGEWTGGAADRTEDVVNPATEQVVAQKGK